jgi:CRP-like cAMP-binding protein
VRIASKGAIFGHRGIGTSSIYPISATALEPCKVCYFDLDFFTTTLKVNHELAYHLLMFFADELQDSERKMRNLAHMSVKGRVAQSLITLSDQFGKTDEGFIDIELTRQDLASFAGATYETVFRTIHELTNEGLIWVKGKSIGIKDSQKLRDLTIDATSN